MRSQPKPLHRHGFTLVELIVTITIIILLAGLVVGGFGFIREKQAQETARIQIALLSRGADEYNLDMGVHPGEARGDADDAAGDNSEVLYQALYFEGWHFLQNGSLLDAESTDTIYVAELDPTNSAQGWLGTNPPSTPVATQKIIDPWGRNYRYRIGANAMNPDFDLWSAGKNGETDPGGVGSPYDPTSDDNRDDLRNF